MITPGISRLKCDECGHTFIGVEWTTMLSTAMPVQCSQCKSFHTYSVGLKNLYGVLGPSQTDKNRWKEIEKNKN